VWCFRISLHNSTVIPADPRESGGRAGIQDFEGPLDSRLRGNDEGNTPNFSWKFSCRTLDVEIKTDARLRRL